MMGNIYGMMLVGGLMLTVLRRVSLIKQTAVFMLGYHLGGTSID